MKKRIDRERLAELLSECFPPEFPWDHRGAEADYLLDHGIIVTPCKVGKTVWCVIEDKQTEDGWFISEEHVTDVGKRGIWLSDYAIPKDDQCDFIPWEDFGINTFTAYEEAETAMAERVSAKKKSKATDSCH